MPGALLDTHTLYWLVSGHEKLTDNALVTIGENQASNTLFVSPISAWELCIAVRKSTGAPHIEEPVRRWFRAALKASSAKLLPIGQNVAADAGDLPAMTGHKDPGDCFIMAAARSRDVPVITRDAKLRSLATAGYFKVVVC